MTWKHFSVEPHKCMHVRLCVITVVSKATDCISIRQRRMLAIIYSSVGFTTWLRIHFLIYTFARKEVRTKCSRPDCLFFNTCYCTCACAWFVQVPANTFRINRIPTNDWSVCTSAVNLTTWTLQRSNGSKIEFGKTDQHIIASIKYALHTTCTDF